MHNVFVYGTLKSGMSNHHLLKGLKRMTAFAKDIEIHASQSIPFAIRGRGNAVGEVYEVDEKTLESLDALERHPEWYQREETEVRLSDGRETQAWIYLNDEACNYPQVPGNDWHEARSLEAQKEC